MKVFSKILIANRGEIALRIIRTLKNMNISTVAVYNKADKYSEHVRAADESYFLEGETLTDTYLNIDKIIKIALDSNTEAIHPGYGFLSENPEFSKKITESGINFIGPTSEVIKMMGDKEEARKIAKNAKIPVLEGVEGKADQLFKKAKSLDFPLLVKASAGGGGKGMRVARNEKELKEVITITSREALNYFGNPNLIIERYLDNARHIEIQVLADHYNNYLILGDRECTVQRRHQKVIEEAPAFGISAETRRKMTEVSLSLISSMDYTNAGTIEFLLDEKENFYFLEMNTRIQVEHPVSELITGIDIVKQQVIIAAGNKLEISQDDIKLNGHAIEARLYAENPDKEFLPAPGFLSFYEEPVSPGLRIDSAITGPAEINPDFDPMISKVIMHADNRNDAILELEKAIKNYKLTGVNTNREFLCAILNSKEFIKNQISTTWLERERVNLLDQSLKIKNSIDENLVLFSWILKRLEKSNMSSGSVWNAIGKWRIMSKWHLLFKAKERKVTIVKQEEGIVHIEIDDTAFILRDFKIEDEKVRFNFKGVIYNAVVISGKNTEDIVLLNGFEFLLRPFDFLPGEEFIKESIEEGSSGPGIIKSPLHGKIVKLNTNKNALVSKGELLLTLDAMKIENKIVSPSQGKIKAIFIKEGDQVQINQNLIEIEYHL